MMINTMGTNAAAAGGVMIGSSNPAFDPNSEITDEDERRGALAFLAEQEKKSKFRDRRAIQLD